MKIAYLQLTGARRSVEQLFLIRWDGLPARAWVCRTSKTGPHTQKRYVLLLGLRPGVFLDVCPLDPEHLPVVAGA